MRTTIAPWLLFKLKNGILGNTERDILHILSIKLLPHPPNSIFVYIHRGIFRIVFTSISKGYINQKLFLVEDKIFRVLGRNLSKYICCVIDIGFI